MMEFTCNACVCLQLRNTPHLGVDPVPAPASWLVGPVNVRRDSCSSFAAAAGPRAWLLRKPAVSPDPICTLPGSSRGPLLALAPVCARAGEAAERGAAGRDGCASLLPRGRGREVETTCGLSPALSLLSLSQGDALTFPARVCCLLWTLVKA